MALNVFWKYETGHSDGTAGDACVLLWLWLNPIMISKGLNMICDITMHEWMIKFNSLSGDSG